jgi:hypothetical protein
MPKMERRFYFTLLVLAVLLLALPGLTVKGIRRVTRHPRRLVRWLPDSLPSRPASRLTS